MIVRALQHLHGAGMAALRSTLIVAASLSAAFAEPQQAPEILIGLVAPVTGVNRLTGEFMLRGGILAQDEINAAGGILGRPVRLVAVDEGNSLQDSVRATRMLLAEKGLVAVVGSLFPEYVLGAAIPVEAAKVPFLAASAPWTVCGANKPHIWQSRLSAEQQIDLLMDFAISRKNVRNPAVLFSASGGYPQLAKRAEDSFARHGLPLGEGHMYALPDDKRMFSGVLSRVAAAGHDGLILLVSPLTEPLLREKWAATGLGPQTFPCFDATPYNTLGSLFTGGRSAEGWYGLTEWLVGGLCSTGAMFDQAYSVRFGIRPELPAVVVYRSLELIKEACEMARSTEPERVNAALQNASTACHMLKSRSVDACLAIVKVVNGKPHPEAFLSGGRP